MKTVAQNCRGLGNQPAVNGLLELQRTEDPDILFLSETKLVGREMEFLRWKLNMPNMVVVDSVGRSGGLALFWKREVDVSLRWKGRYHIDVDVMEENGTKWRLTGIYGESKAGEKENTWKLLRNLHEQSDLPWMIMGDFNEILFAGEKEGGPARNQGCMDAFRRTLEHCELEDLGYVGDPFTWRNNWHVASGYIRERLDRVVANSAWRCLFPLYKVINGDPRHSDHRPLITELNEQSCFLENRGSGEKCFRFEASWLQEEGCEHIIEEA
jgi:exonuclease III